MKFQSILCIETTDNSLRSEAVGWGPYEDGQCVQNALQEYRSRRLTELPVGLIQGRLTGMPSYPTVLHAMGAGWRVMGPPTKEERSYMDGDGHCCFENYYTWWLEKLPE